MTVSITSFADEDQLTQDTICQWLQEYNFNTNPEYFQNADAPFFQSRSLNLTATLGDQIVGGLLAHTQGHWLKISIMAVDSRFRRQGIGKLLLTQAEELAVARSCQSAFVDTMCYQAPEFYHHAGYALIGSIPDWDSCGHTKCFLTKTLI